MLCKEPQAPNPNPAGIGKGGFGCRGARLASLGSALTAIAANLFQKEGFLSVAIDSREALACDQAFGPSTLV